MIQVGYPASAGGVAEPGAAQNSDRVALGRAMMLADGAYGEIAATFRALADATRTKIVYSLLQQELCTSELASVAGVSESVVSQHLRVLRELRLVRSRRDGKLVYHTLDDAHIRILLSVALDHIRDADRAGSRRDSGAARLQAAAQRSSTAEEAGYGA